MPACNFIKNEALAQVFSCEFLRTPCFLEHLWWLLLRNDNSYSCCVCLYDDYFLFFWCWGWREQKKNLTYFHNELRSSWLTIQSYQKRKFPNLLNNHFVTEMFNINTSTDLYRICYFEKRDFFINCISNRLTYYYYYYYYYHYYHYYY